MRSVRSTADGIAVVDAAVSGTGVRIRITSAGICGSDLHAIASGAIPVVLGHEFGGRLDDGSLVAVLPFAPCGDCEHCTADAEHLCAIGQQHFHGATLDGGLAEEVRVHERNLIRVPGVEAENVALVEPIAVAVHAINRAEVAPGERALVIGGGTIGLLCAALLRDRGAEVTITARHPRQLGAARDLSIGTGASGRYSLVVDAAGSASSFRQAGSSARRGGRIVLVALPWEPLAVAFGLVLKEVDVLPSIYYSPREFEQAAAFLAQHPEVAAAIVTHRFGLDDAREAFRTAGDRGAGAIKVLVTP